MVARFFSLVLAIGFPGATFLKCSLRYAELAVFVGFQKIFFYLCMFFGVTTPGSSLKCTCLSKPDSVLE